jgi:hypothetical protein
MSMIAEQAGGCGSTGFQRVLDIVPEKVGAGGGGLWGVLTIIGEGNHAGMQRLLFDCVLAGLC